MATTGNGARTLEETSVSLPRRFSASSRFFSAKTSWLGLVMASIGKLFIAGKEKYDGEYISGAAFSLSATSPIDFSYTTKNGKWVVDFATGHQKVVARSKARLSKAEIASYGFAAIQEALDILAVMNRFYSVVDSANKQQVIVSSNEDDLILSVHDSIAHPMSMRIAIKSVNEHGIETDWSGEKFPEWHQSFRYYRLSQASPDLFEAYRNLYLSFETLLDSVSQKKKGEKEVDWLRRGLGNVAKKVRSLDNVTIEDLITRQYKNMRCKLLHAKGKSALLPHASINPFDVKCAYEELLRVWRSIASSYYGFFVSGGVITNIGFEKIMENFLSQGVYTQHTSDKKPPTVDDVVLSQEKNLAFEMAHTEFLGPVSPGVVQLVSRESCSKQFENADCYSIHKIGCYKDSSLLYISYFEEALIVTGVKQFEYSLDLRHENTTLPKTSFNF